MKTNRTAVATALALAIAGVVALAVFREVSIEAVYPVERARLAFMRKVWTRMKGFFQGAAASAENGRLKRDIAALAMVMSENERLEAENARLRDALGYARRLKGTWIAAPVLSEGGAAAGVRQTIRVGKGSLAGVSEGQVVTVPEGLVGRVASVTPHTAEIRPITDPALKVSCLVEGASRRATGILAGGTDDMLVLTHLTADVALPPRARVLTSGLGGVFPAGIAVGTFLSAVQNADGSAPGVRTGEVQPAVDFMALEDVFIRDEK